jgi:hypothetical protein
LDNFFIFVNGAKFWIHLTDTTWSPIMKERIDKLNLTILDFLIKLKREGNETSEAAIILSRYAKGEKISLEDAEKFRNQMIDVIKMLGIGIPFVVIPGSTLLLPIVLSVAKKYNIDIFPSSFKENKNSN